MAVKAGGKQRRAPQPREELSVYERYEEAALALRILEERSEDVQAYRRIADQMEELLVQLKDAARPEVKDLDRGERVVFKGRLFEVVVQVRRSADRFDPARVLKLVPDAERRGLVATRVEANNTVINDIIHADSADEDLKLRLADARIPGERLTPSVSIKPRTDAA